MALHDPISDFLTRLRNAVRARHRYVDASVSKVKINIAKVLQERGFIDRFLVDESKRQIRVFLKYDSEREGFIEQIKRVSMPGLRRFIGYRNIPRVKGGMGLAILSTPKGVIDGEVARKEKVGGELLCIVW
jgi:small subunit ribosomal protein S8